jgi:tetratricopeptide (TPR) repeat protein
MSATKVKKKQQPKYFVEEPVEESDFTRFGNHVRENPMYYAVGALCVVVGVVAGVLYNAHTRTAWRDASAAFADAMSEPDPIARLAALETLADRDTALQAEVLYMLGETAFAEGEYETARSAFARVRDEFGDSEVAADAVEGLGFVREEADQDYEGAIALYEEVKDRWPDSFAAARQPTNVARCHEQREEFEAAAAAYREQTQVLNDSNLAENAQLAIARLEASHPEVFGASEAAPVPEEAGEAEAAPEQVELGTTEEGGELRLNLPDPGGDDLGESVPRRELSMPGGEDATAIQEESPLVGEVVEGVGDAAAESGESDDAPADGEPDPAQDEPSGE